MGGSTQVGLGAVTASENSVIDPQDWGRLEWMVSGAIGNSDKLTVGKYINPGKANPPHFHPNCDEVLHVLRGTIRHRVGDNYVRMGPADTISIPQGVVHNAHNFGEDTAEFIIVFSTSMREVVGE